MSVTTPETASANGTQEETPAVDPEAIKESPKETEEDVQNIIEPRANPRVQALKYSGSEREYIQRPLTLFRKLEFFGLVGETIDAAMEGQDGLRINDIFGGDGVSVGIGDLDSFLSAAAKVAHYAPDFLKDCYLIWLDVPKEEKLWAKDALDTLSDEDGIEIIETFIDQNWESIERFFTERLRSLGKRVQNRRKSPASNEQSSTR